MLPYKNPKFILGQVCPLDDKQTTLKMLVSWMEFGSIRAMLCWYIFPWLARLSDFLAHFPPCQLHFFPVWVWIDVLLSKIHSKLNLFFNFCNLFAHFCVLLHRTGCYWAQQENDTKEDLMVNVFIILAILSFIIHIICIINPTCIHVLL